MTKISNVDINVMLGKEIWSVPCNTTGYVVKVNPVHNTVVLEIQGSFYGTPLATYNVTWVALNEDGSYTTIKELEEETREWTYLKDQVILQKLISTHSLQTSQPIITPAQRRSVDAWISPL